MDENRAHFAKVGSVAILFHPSTVPLIDTFRSLDSLEGPCNIHVLDEPERELARFISPQAAKSIVSDAMLLAFALGQQRGQPLTYGPLKSRQGSPDEYCLLTLIGASRDPGSQLALEAAAALGMASADYITSLAGSLLRQIDGAGLVLAMPGLSEFRAVVGDCLFIEGRFEEFRNFSGFTFQS
ncbi:hypothetical protein [Microvirga sp. 2TAF3]|uniref:hypothetical protein n=1 Tax=Microvirga sp. 2TAF3 TaxID=3233014 RepID=UPI003F97E67F